MLKIIDRLKNDSLFQNVINTKTPIDRFTFLTLYLFRMVVLFCLYGIVSNVLMLPVTFWLVQNLLNARLLHIGVETKQRKALAVILSLVYTVFIFMSLTLEYTMVYHLPPQLLLRNANFIHTPINNIVSAVNLVHVLCGLTVLISVILLSCIKGKNETEGFVIKPTFPASFSDIIAKLFRFRGSLSRIGFLYLNTVIGILSTVGFLVVLIFMVVTKDNITDNLFMSGFALVWCLLMLLMTAAVAARRFHDTKRSGWGALGYIAVMFLYVVMNPTLLQVVTTKILTNKHSDYIIYSIYLTPLLGIFSGFIRLCGLTVIAFLNFYPGKEE